MVLSSTKSLDLIAQTIYDRKGFNILALDVKDFSSIADYYVIAEGNVDRHIRSISKELQDVMNEAGLTLLRADGQSSDWLVLDYGDIVIHLLVPELREKYALEQLWKTAKIVDLHIDTKSL